MKKMMSVIFAAAMLLSIIVIVPVSASVATTDFNHYAMEGKAPLSVDANGDFISTDNTVWKLSEYKTTPETDFVAEMDVYAINGFVKDSIIIRSSNASEFSTRGFDGITGFGVFVEASAGGSMYIYVNKWVNGTWKGYLPRQGSNETNWLDHSIVQNAGSDYTITLRVSVQGDIVKAQTFLKGTEIKTVAATFDLTAPASGEDVNNNSSIPAGGNISLATMRTVSGKLFGNFKYYNNGDFNGYGSDANIGLANDNGTLIGDGTSWKMSEYKNPVEADFTAKVDMHTTDGQLKDSINFRMKNASAFSTGGYDATTGFGAFVESNQSGTMYLYINKWCGGWKGYLPRVDIAETNLTNTDLLSGVGNSYVVTLEITVKDNVVTMQAFLKGTDKSTDKVSFDLTAPATGETANNNAAVTADGTLALTTQRWWAKGSVFSNFTVTNKSENDTDGEFKYYSTDGNPGITFEDGVFSSSGTAWKLIETPSQLSDNFEASVECLPTASGIKDSICFRIQTPEKFTDGGFDLTTGYGVFVETAGPGKPLYIYMDKWANGAWLGYLVPIGKLDANICDGEIMKGVGSDYSIVLDVTVEGNIVKAQASIKGTNKKTEVAVFDLAKKFTGESDYATIPYTGKICIGTMRTDAGEYFSNFSVSALKEGGVKIPQTGDDGATVVYSMCFIMVTSAMALILILITGAKRKRVR